jgi:hypothetical protein
MAFIHRRFSPDDFFEKAPMHPCDIKASAIRAVFFCFHIGRLVAADG